MTVQEVIELLSTFDPDLTVFVSGNAPVVSLETEGDGTVVVLLEPED